MCNHKREKLPVVLEFFATQTLQLVWGTLRFAIVVPQWQIGS